MTALSDDNAGNDKIASPQKARRLAEVLDHYLVELEEGGIPPDLEALVADHPDLADEIRSYAKSLELVHRMTAGLRPSARRITAADTVSESVAPGRPGAAPVKQLGDYEILREIGRGGMGVVYEARQISLNRRVALKVLPFAAMLDEKQIARFRNEAQAAAQLHHPNIVSVHAVGEERSVHFFAMQYVAGRSLECAIEELRQAAGLKPGPLAPTQPASAVLHVPQRDRDTEVDCPFSTRVSTRSRGYCHSAARLMRQAADALHHAHELGVIHRDVKPSNLLLDREGKLWVTDFGLARIQAGSGVTLSGDVVGTLRYMSPEQAAGQSALVDARTDVYGLGVTLYELLTLRPAHGGDARQEILRLIESRDPPPPRRINPAIPVDLETIVQRAMARNRDERYPTAQALADDLGRFLEGQPTLARRPSAIDRAAKWAVRHRNVAAVAALFLVLLAGVAGTGAVLLARAEQRTEQALDDSQQNLVRSKEHFQQARDVVDRFGSGLAGELAAVPGTEPVRRKLLASTLKYYRNFIAQARAEDDEGLKRDLAATSLKAAPIAAALGERKEALKLCQDALNMYGALIAAAPTDDGLVAQRAQCNNSLGLLHAEEGHTDEAFKAYGDAIADEEALAKKASAGPETIRSLAESYSNLGLLQAQTGQKDEACRSLAASIVRLEKLVDRAPQDRGYRHDLAIAYNNLSFIERETDWAASQQACEQAIEILEKLAAETKAETNEDLSCRADLALCYNNLGAIQGHREHWPAAYKSYDEAIRLQRQLARQAPAVVSYRRDLCVSLNNLGQGRDAQGDAAGAIRAYDEGQQIASELADDYPDEPAIQSLCGGILNNRAMTLEAAGGLEAAIAGYKAAAEHQQIALDRSPQTSEYRNHLSKHYFNLGRALRAAGRPLEAAAVAGQRRKLWPGDGEHLGQVVVELAQAAAQASHSGTGDDADAQAAAGRLRDDAQATLREAAAAGCDVEKLRQSGALAGLDERSGNPPAAQAPSPAS